MSFSEADDPADEGRLSIRELMSRAAEAVGSSHEARWLCEVATALDGAQLDASLDHAVTTRMVAHLDEMVARYCAGEPLQYVLGRWGFRRLDLAIDDRVLIPRPETEVVAGVAIELAATIDGPRVVADLGTGSGAIGLSMATELPMVGTTVWMTDVDHDALAVARANLAGIGVAGVNVRIGHGSWFDALPGELLLDLVVSNPPYVAVGSPQLDDAVRSWEPDVALFGGADGLDAIRVIAEGALGRLRPDRWLVLEVGSDQGPSVRDLLADAGYLDIEVRPDHAGHDRVAIGRMSG